MKKLIIIICLLITLPVMAYGSFCAGYKAGYAAGYCHGDYYCIKPIPPICPIPHIGERTYMDGYNRGFLDGLNG